MHVQIFDIRGLEQDVIVHFIVGEVFLSCARAAFSSEALHGLKRHAGFFLVNCVQDTFIPNILVRNKADNGANKLAGRSHSCPNLEPQKASSLREKEEKRRRKEVANRGSPKSGRGSWPLRVR
jgi:hypothetical protein